MSLSVVPNATPPFMAERVAKSSLIHEPSFCFGPCIPLPFFARGFTLYDLKTELIGLRNLFVAQSFSI